MCPWIPSLLSAALCIAPAVGQAPARHDAELAVLESRSVLPDFGPGAGVTWTVTQDGTLFVWAESRDFDPVLQVEDADGRLHLQDDDNGGGTTAWVRTRVESGLVLRIQAAAKAGAQGGRVRLCIRELPASEESRIATEDANAAFAEANGFALSQDLRAARELLEPAVEALLAAPGIEHDADAHAALWRLGRALYDWGDVKLVLKVFESLARFQKESYPPDSRARLQPLSELCGLLGQLGRGAEAWPWCEEARGIAERSFGAQSLESAIVRFNLGTALFANHDLETARDVLGTTADDFARLRGRDDILTAQADLTFGSVLCELGLLDEARRRQEHAVEVLTKSLGAGDLRLFAAENNLAATLSALGDDRAARAIHQRLLEEARRVYEPDHVELLKARHNAAIDLLRLWEFEGARAEFEALAAAYLRLGLAAGADAEMADIARADAENKLGRHRDALRTVEARRRLRAEQGRRDAAGEWRIAAQHAQALFGLGESVPALQQAEASLQSATRALTADNPDLAEVRQLAARLNLKLGRQERAYELTRQAVSDAEGYLARCATTLSTSEAEAAQAHWSRLVSDGLALLDATAPAAERAAAAAQAFELAESARGIGTALISCAKAGSVPGIEALRRKVREAARQVVSVGVGDQPTSVLEAAIAAKERAERDLRDALSLLVGPELAAARPDAAAIGRSLAPDEVLIAWWRSDVRAIDAPQSAPREARLCAFVLRAGAGVRKQDLGPLAPIAAAVEAWRAAVAGGGPESDALEAEAGDRLRRLVVDPLRAAIGDAARWRVALDDVLNLVALDALPCEGGRLGDRVSVVATPTSAKGSTQDASAAGPAGFLALGGIDYDHGPRGAQTLEVAASSAQRPPSIRAVAPRGGFSALWETRDEIDALAELYARTHGDGGPPILLEDRAATKGALVQAAPRAGYVHVATHGFFALKERAAASAAETALAQRSPLALCGLALTGANAGTDESAFEGVITAEELATLDLSRCRLVVLSACDSNAGMLSAGQGLASFQKALHAAGARVVVTSLWKVSDATTRELMTAFYTGMWVEGLTPEQALWKAKAQRIARRAPARDWAGWILSRR